ncbi:MAG: hypothetical protein LBD59_11965 [Prevotellaceae bacterium]|jgi:hypothetical protein|nr:hypothetical protein [Prevotellaceae bacterium]
MSLNKLKSLANSKVQSTISSIQNNEDITTGIVEKIVSIDYLKAIEFINQKKFLILKSEIILSALTTLHNASNKYRSTEDAQNKDQLFLTAVTNNIDAEQTIAAIEPVVKLIPYGTLILFALKMSVKFKNKVSQ